jgi:acyl-CoA thioester hydrolase
MMQIIETPIQKRFADIDMFRHVNNIHQAAYLDLGKTDYYARVLGLDAPELAARTPTLVIVSTHTDFAAQIRYDDPIVVRTRVEKIGTKSITLRQQIVRLGGSGPESAETICTDSSSTLVCFDPRTQGSVEIPAEWRAAINP